MVHVLWQTVCSSTDTDACQ